MTKVNLNLMSIAALAGLVSISAGAAPVLDPVETIAPIEVAPVEIAPVKPVVAAPVAARPVVGAPQAGSTTTAPAATDDAFSGMTTKAQACSAEDLATQMTNGTTVSYADALAAIKFWGNKISIGTCHADVGGLISYEAPARENFLKAAVAAMNTLQSKGDYSSADAKQAWTDSLATVLGVPSDTASSTIKKLATNCHILDQSIAE